MQLPLEEIIFLPNVREDMGAERLIVGTGRGSIDLVRSLDNVTQFLKKRTEQVYQQILAKTKTGEISMPYTADQIVDFIRIHISSYLSEIRNKNGVPEEKRKTFFENCESHLRGTYASIKDKYTEYLHQKHTEKTQLLLQHASLEESKKANRIAKGALLISLIAIVFTVLTYFLKK